MSLTVEQSLMLQRMSFRVPCGCVGASTMFSFSLFSLESVTLPILMYCASQKHNFSFQMFFAHPLLIFHISYQILSYLLNNTSPYALHHVSEIGCCHVDVHNCIGVHNYKIMPRIANK